MNFWQRWRQRYWIRQARLFMAEYQATQDNLDQVTELFMTNQGPGIDGCDLTTYISLYTYQLAQLDDKRPAWLNLPNGETPMTAPTKDKTLTVTFLNMEYRLKDALQELNLFTKSNNKTDFVQLKDELDQAYAKLHAMIDAPKQDASDLDIVSIQVQTTRLTGAGVEMVSFKEQHNLPTHWSLYKRQRNGQAVWVQDFAIPLGNCADTLYSKVMVAAAKLSMAYKAFIEEPY